MKFPEISFICVNADYQVERKFNGEREAIFGKNEDRKNQAGSKPEFRITFERLSEIACELKRAGIPVNALHIASRLGVPPDTLIVTPAWKRAVITGEVEP